VCAACLPLPACALLACLPLLACALRRCSSSPALQATLPPPLLTCCCVVAAAAPALLPRRRRGLHAAAPPSWRLRCVQSLAGEEAWSVAIQYFESNISTFRAFNFNIFICTISTFYYQMLNQFNKMLN
jgi:hypothetical protein